METDTDIDMINSGPETVGPDDIEESDEEVELPLVGQAPRSVQYYFEEANHHVIRTLMRDSARAIRAGASEATPPTANTEQGRLLHRLELMLNWLDLNMENYRTPLAEANMKNHLLYIFDPTQSRMQLFFSDDMIVRAENLYNLWVAGEAQQTEEQQNQANDHVPPVSAPQTHTVARRTANQRGYVRNPPRSHPVYGEHGVMKGVSIIYGQGGGRRYILNDDYASEKKRADTYGHNGLQPGDWWPMQCAAVFNGAHGSWMGGIYKGTGSYGAYSIVVAQTYDGMDKDEGDTLYYSGSNSHDNENPLEPAQRTNNTDALHASIASQKPVRVLRKGLPGKKSNPWAPTIGIRYDGLYKVVSVERPLNLKGGMYERFKLTRLTDGQPPLSAFRRTSPTSHQISQYELVRQGY